jgi:transcriptional regulator with XRE-family HTH domain
MLNKSTQYSATNLLTVDGAELTKARIRANLTLGDVAAKLSGCNQSSVSRWEQEKLTPSVERIFLLVDLFGTNDFVRLNGKAVLTSEEIEVVRKLREE